MNTRHVFTTLLATALVSVSAANAKDKSDANKQPSYSRGSLEMHRIADDSLENIVTAKKLIGSSVYDGAGEKIGDIADISMGQALGSNVSQEYRSAQRDNNASMSSGEYGAASSGTGYATNATGRSKANKSDMKNDKDASTSWSSGMGSDATVFISVGGLWGMGDDIVAVPAKSLSYNQEKEQFTLAASKSEVVALAEQDPTELDENFDWNTQTWNDDTDYSAKQSFDSQVDDVRDAIRVDSTLRNEDNINVSAKNGTLVLDGTVSSDKAKSRAQAVAEDHTDLDVQNSLKVKE